MANPLIILKALTVLVVLAPPPVHLQQDDVVDCAAQRKSQKVQMMFLVDQSSSFANYYTSFTAALDQVVDEVSDIHPNPQFGAALFGNWKGEPDSCYALISPLTADHLTLKSSLKQVEPNANGDDYENALAAIAFLATDPLASWDLEPVDIDGRHTRRIVVLMTDTPPKWLLTSKGDRRPFVGDGSDSCLGSFPPSYNDVRRVLRKMDIGVVGFYSNGSMVGEYDDRFWSVGTPYCAGEFGERKGAFSERFVEVVGECSRELLRCATGE